MLESQEDKPEPINQWRFSHINQQYARHNFDFNLFSMHSHKQQMKSNLTKIDLRAILL